MLISVHSPDQLKKLNCYLQIPFFTKMLPCDHWMEFLYCAKTASSTRKLFIIIYNYTCLEYFTQSYTKGLGSFTTQNDRVKIIQVSSRLFVEKLKNSW